MFKNRILQVKVVPDPPENKPIIKIIDPVREFEKVSDILVGTFIIYKLTDTVCKIVLHTATVKIK